MSRRSTRNGSVGEEPAVALKPSQRRKSMGISLSKEVKAKPRRRKSEGGALDRESLPKPASVENNNDEAGVDVPKETFKANVRPTDPALDSSQESFDESASSDESDSDSDSGDEGALSAAISAALATTFGVAIGGSSGTGVTGGELPELALPEKATRRRKQELDARVDTSPYLSSYDLKKESSTAGSGGRDALGGGGLGGSVRSEALTARGKGAMPDVAALADASGAYGRVVPTDGATLHGKSGGKGGGGRPDAPPTTSGKGWFDLPATVMTDEVATLACRARRSRRCRCRRCCRYVTQTPLGASMPSPACFTHPLACRGVCACCSNQVKADLRAVRMRSALDPTRFYKVLPDIVHGFSFLSWLRQRCS